MDQRKSAARARHGAVSRRGLTAALCAGVMLAATVAWVVGHDISSRYSYETFDRLVGGSGIVAVVLATIALPRAGWARLPLLATIALGPMGLVATEAGWIVTEVGRQPWVIYGVLRTSAAATPLANMWLPLVAFTLVYIGLAAVVVAILVRQFRAAAEVA